MTQTTASRINIRRKPAAPATAPAVEATPARKAVRANLRSKTAVSAITFAAGAIAKFFVFVDGARPVSGARLFAHTDAALRFTGMAEQRTVRKNVAIAIMGARAIKHHLGQGNLEEEADKVRLTTAGYNKFKGRVDEGGINGDLAAAFLAAIRSGTTNAAAGIKDNHLVPVAMTW